MANSQECGYWIFSVKWGMGLCLSFRFVTHFIKGYVWPVALPPHHPSLFWVTPWRNSQPSWPACVSHWVFNSYCYNIESPLISTHFPHTVYNVCKFQQKLFYSFLLLSTSPVSLINLLCFPVLVGLDHVEEDPWDTQSSQHLSSDQGHL